MKHRGEKIHLKQAILSKINHLYKKNTLRDNEVYNLTKDFFKEYLKIEYEYTHDELKKELNKVYLKKDVKNKLFIFLEDIGKIEYQNQPHTQQDLKRLLSALKEIVQILVQEEKKRERITRQH